MSEFLPEAIRTELDAARRKTPRRRSSMKVRTGGQDITILRHWDGGFALDADEAEGLPGRVDLYEGSRHLCQVLVVASAEEGGERVFEVKTTTPAYANPPAVDFVRERREPAGLLIHR